MQFGPGNQEKIKGIDRVSQKAVQVTLDNVRRHEPDMIEEKFGKTQGRGGHAEKQNHLIRHPSVDAGGLVKNNPEKKQGRELQHAGCENAHEKIDPVFKFSLKGRVKS